MEIVIGWLFFAALVGMFANSRGRSGFGFFLLSALLSPLLGFVIVLVIKNLDEEERLTEERRREQERKDYDRKLDNEKQLEALRAVARSPAVAQAPLPAPLTVAEEVAKLGDLLHKGLLTETEFAEQKALVLRRGG